MTERGIRPGLSKWKHDKSTSISSRAAESGPDSVGSKVTKITQNVLSPAI